MKAPFLARKTHKWLALILGVQATLWMISGAYMATIDIDFIHGDPLVRNTAEPLDEQLTNLYPIAAVLERFPQATGIDLISRLGRPHYAVVSEQTPALLDATSGQAISPIGRDLALSMANHYYAGDGQVTEAQLLSDLQNRPSEIQARALPLWQVRFDDSITTTFYISPSTGELIARRHTFWRLYDFLWMFHIMDYENRTDINNNLLRVAALFGFLFALSGAWLLVHSLKKHQAIAERPADDGYRSVRNYDLVPKTP